VVHLYPVRMAAVYSALRAYLEPLQSHSLLLFELHRPATSLALDFPFVVGIPMMWLNNASQEVRRAGDLCKMSSESGWK